MQISKKHQKEQAVSLQPLCTYLGKVEFQYKKNFIA